jgi:hypothetical protein
MTSKVLKLGSHGGAQGFRSGQQRGDEKITSASKTDREPKAALTEHQPLI